VQGNRLRINFILPFYSERPIGGFKTAYEYANELAARGHEVSLIHPRFMRNIERSKGFLRRVQHATLNSRNYLSPRAALGWQPLRDDVRFLFVAEPTAQNIPDADIVFATAWQTAEYVFEYPRQKGEQFYLVMDFDPWIASRETLEKTWRWPLTKITISNWLYEKVLSAGCTSSEVVNIPIGINFERFNFTNQIENRGKSVLMLFSSSPSKGSADGLNALVACRREHPDLEVVLFGPNYRRRPPDLPRWAKYRGNVSDQELRQLYNESSVYVCSSLAEGFAMPPAEAMACGCAVAATDCGGIREFAVDGQNALLSPAGKPALLAQNILRLIEDEELRRRLARRGRETIQAFTWSAATDKLESAIDLNLRAFRAAS
jgi:glycosyltransferase involved in cell wall biosynthesis